MMISLVMMALFQMLTSGKSLKISAETEIPKICIAQFQRAVTFENIFSEWVCCQYGPKELVQSMELVSTVILVI